MAGVLLAGLCMLGALGWMANVSKHLTHADLTALASIGITSSEAPGSYEEELARIRDVQARVQRAVRIDGSTPPPGHPIEPSDLLRRGAGACYELSRAIEKGLALHHIQTRRVFFLYRQDQTFWSALIRRGHPSHAATEVKTRKGWLLVDSTSPWMALDKQGDPIPANGIWPYPERFNAVVPEHLLLSSWALRGLYSRAGQLYGSPLRAPEVNWRELSGWLTSSDEDRHLH